MTVPNRMILSLAESCRCAPRAVLAACLLFVAACLVAPPAPAQVRAAQVFGLTESEAHEMSQSLARHYTDLFGVSGDARLVGYLEGIAARVQTGTRLSGHLGVLLIESDEVNAFVSADSTIFVFRGLLRFARSREEIAGVFAHEMAHLQNKDVDKALEYAERTAEQTGDSKLKGIVDRVRAAIVGKHESREAEFRADQYGVDFLLGAGMPPDGLASFLRRMQETIEQGQKLGGAARIISDLMASHPETAERVKRLDAYVKEKNAPLDARRHALDLAPREDGAVLVGGLAFPQALSRFDQKFPLSEAGTRWTTLGEMKGWPGKDRAGLGQPLPRANRLLRGLMERTGTLAELDEVMVRYRALSNEDAAALAANVARVSDLSPAKNGKAYAAELQKAMASVDWRVVPDCPLETSELGFWSVAQYLDRNERETELLQRVQEDFGLHKRLCLEGGLLTHLVKSGSAVDAEVARDVLGKVLLDCEPTHGGAPTAGKRGNVILFDFLSLAARTSKKTFLETAAFALPVGPDFYQKHRFARMEGARKNLTFEEFFLQKLITDATTREDVDPAWLLPSLADYAAFCQARSSGKEAGLGSLSTLLMFALEGTANTGRGFRETSPERQAQLKAWMRSFFGDDYARTIAIYDRLSPRQTEGEHQEENARYHDYQLLFALGYLHPNKAGKMTAADLEAAKPLLSPGTRPLVDEVIATMAGGDAEKRDRALLKLVARHAQSFITGGEIALMARYFLDDARKLRLFRHFLEQGELGSVREGDADEAFGSMVRELAGSGPVETARRAAKDFDGSMRGLVRFLELLPPDFEYRKNPNAREHYADEHKDVRRVLEYALEKKVRTAQDCRELLRYFNGRLSKPRFGDGPNTLVDARDEALARRTLERGVELSLPAGAGYPAARDVILDWTHSCKAYGDTTGDAAKELTENLEKGLPEQIAFFDRRWAGEALVRAFIRGGVSEDLEILNRDLDALDMLAHARRRLRELAGAAGYQKLADSGRAGATAAERLATIQRLLPEPSDARDGLLTELLADAAAAGADDATRRAALALMFSHDEAARGGLAEYRRFEAGIPKDQRDFDRLVEGVARYLPEPSRERDALLDEVTIRYAQSKAQSDRAKALGWDRVTEPQRQATRYFRENDFLLKPDTRREFLRNTSPASIVGLLLAFFNLEAGGGHVLSAPEQQMVGTFRRLAAADREKLVEELLVGFHGELDQAEGQARDSGMYDADNAGFSRTSAKEEFIGKIISALFGVDDPEGTFMAWLLSRDLHLLPKERSARIISTLLRAKSDKVSLPELVALYLCHRGVVSRKAGQIFSTFESVPQDYREQLANLKSKVEIEFDKGELIELLHRELPDVKVENVGKKLGQASLRIAFQARVNGQDCVMKVIHPDAPRLVYQDIDIYDKMVAELDARPDLRRKFGIENPRGEFNQIVLSLLEELDSGFEIRYSAEYEKGFDKKNVTTSKVYAASRNIVVEQLVRGKELYPAVREYGLDGHEVAATLTREFMREIFITGFFHADPHDGNIFVSENGQTFFLIDKGLMGRLPSALRDRFFELLMLTAVADRTGKFTGKLTETLTGLGYRAEASFDEKKLQAGLAAILKDRSETLGQKLNAIFQEAKRQGFSFDRNFFLLTKALVTIEGVCAGLDEKFTLGPALTRAMVGATLRRPADWAKRAWHDLVSHRARPAAAVEEGARNAAWRLLAAGDQRPIDEVIREAARNPAAAGSESDSSVGPQPIASSPTMATAAERFCRVFEIPEGARVKFVARLGAGGEKGGSLAGEKLFNELAKLHLELGETVPFDVRARLLEAIKAQELDVASHRRGVDAVALLDGLTGRGLGLRIQGLGAKKAAAPPLAGPASPTSDAKLKKAMKRGLVLCHKVISAHEKQSLVRAVSVLERRRVVEEWLAEVLPARLVAGVRQTPEDAAALEEALVRRVNAAAANVQQAYRMLDEAGLIDEMTRSLSEALARGLE